MPSPSDRSISAKVVTVDKVDMLVMMKTGWVNLCWKKKERGTCDVRLRQILRFKTGNTILKILFL